MQSLEQLRLKTDKIIADLPDKLEIKNYVEAV